MQDGQRGRVQDGQRQVWARWAKKGVGMTQAQFKNETVTSLRERLRSQKEVQNMTIDPLVKTPKGLGNLLLEELKQECLLRDIQVPQGKDCTRPKMIVLIKDDAANRAEMEKRASRVKMPQGPDDSFLDLSDDEMAQDFAPPSRRTKRK